MIPQRITIEGFLCYRDRQEIDLSGLPLCMLSGPNGSGKSSVFDAITFALFGCHRAGAQGREDLINKRSDAATVEFDFACGGQLWQAWRTITLRNERATTTQQIRRRMPDGNKWEPVPDTTSVAGCNAWVTQCVGLTAESFVTSMLLRQGQADRLLTARPAERADLLKAVVGLERYADLHARAVARRRAVEAELRAVEGRLAGCGAAVSDADVATAAAAAVGAADAAAQADAAVDTLSPLVPLARAWTSLSARLATAITQRAALDGTLARADAIAAAHARLTALRVALPPLRALADDRDRLARSLAAVAQLEADVAANDVERRRVMADLDRLRRDLEQLDVRLAEAADRDRDVADWLAQAGRLLALADAAAGHRRTLAARTAELEQLPPDPAGDLDRATAAADAERARVTALPWLAQLAEHRAALVQATATVAAATADAKRLGGESAVALGDWTAANDRLAMAADDHGSAQAAAAATSADLEHARQWAADLSRADGRADCPTCGKPLTDAQRAAEVARRADRVGRTTAAYDAATDRLRAAEAAVAAARRSVADAEQRRDALASQIRTTAGRAQHAADAVNTHSHSADRAITNLPETWRAKAVGEPDWPTTAECDAVAAEARPTAAAADRALAAARRASTDGERLTAQIDSVRQLLASVPADVPADPAPIRAELDRLTAAQQAIRSAQAGYVEDRKRLSVTLRERQAHADQLTAAHHATTLTLSQERARQEGLREAITAAAAQLPAGWPQDQLPALAEVSALAAEADELDRQGVPALQAELTRARAEVVPLDEQATRLRSDLDDVPAQARGPVHAVEADLSAAREARGRCRADQQRAQAAHDELTRRRDARRQLENDCHQLTATHHHLTVLAEMLDRTGLQLHLMRRAEHQIVGFANAVLDRLSDGSLVLQLRADGDGAERALDLVAVNRRTAGAGGDPLNVAFLSGSQQFRVAVALALAVGQYAGGGHRLGDCVIIDEGFGSLDAGGQAVMIQELHRLTGIMKRVILVSHQESFADAFQHGYRFALDETGSTRVTRLAG
jgi:exonuclease SbcC